MVHVIRFGLVAGDGDVGRVLLIFGTVRAVGYGNRIALRFHLVCRVRLRPVMRLVNRVIRARGHRHLIRLDHALAGYVPLFADVLLIFGAIGRVADGDLILLHDRPLHGVAMIAVARFVNRPIRAIRNRDLIALHDKPMVRLADLPDVLLVNRVIRAVRNGNLIFLPDRPGDGVVFVPDVLFVNRPIDRVTHRLFDRVVLNPIDGVWHRFDVPVVNRPIDRVRFGFVRRLRNGAVADFRDGVVYGSIADRMGDRWNAALFRGNAGAGITAQLAVKGLGVVAESQSRQRGKDADRRPDFHRELHRCRSGWRRGATHRPVLFPQK